MKKWRDNERGLTIIELIATIAIFSIILLLITNVVISSITIHDKSYENLQLGQKANIIITELRSIHETNDTYTIRINASGKIAVNIDGSDRILGEEGYDYEISEEPISVGETDSLTFLTLIITDQDTGRSITLDTTLSRIGGGS
jgi:prepilin-type N-terminal cleavage/methylation domain-containing protein